MAKAVAIAAFAGALALLVVPWLSPRDYECAECTTTADCGDGLRCAPFDDGQSRCVSDTILCRDGHLDTGGTWSHMAMVGLLVVGGLALSAHRLGQSRDT